MEALIAALSSGLTALFGLLIWMWRSREAQRQMFQQQQFDRQQKGISHGQRLINDRYIKEKLDHLRKRFNAQSVIVAKFHNGDYYADRNHVWKWSVTVDSCEEDFCVKETLQNRLTSDTATFLGDLKSDGVSFAGKLENFGCEGLKRLLKLQGINAYLAAMQNCEDKDIQAFVMVLFAEAQTQLTEDDAKGLRQELNTFSSYI